MPDTSSCNVAAAKFFAISNVTNTPAIATRFARRSIHPASLLVGEGEGSEGVEDVVDALCDVFGESRITLANAVRGKGGNSTASGFKLGESMRGAKCRTEDACVMDDITR